MANLTEFGVNTLMNGGTMPSILYVQLHTDDPGPDGDLNVATEDRRMSFSRTTASGGMCSNVNAILWDEIPANETISHISIHDDDVGGNAWWVGDLDDPLVAEADNNLVIASSGLQLSLTYWT